MKIVTEGISIPRRRPYVPVELLIKRAMAGGIDADEFAMQLVSLSVDKYREVGLVGTMAYFARPGSALAGLEEAIAYYNAAETVDGKWSAFIGDPNGKIVGALRRLDDRPGHPGPVRR